MKLLDKSTELPIGWEITKIGKFAEVIMGQSPPSDTYNNEKIGLPFFQGKAEFTDLHPAIKKWCSEPNKIGLPNDILVSVRAPVGSVNIANVECCIGRGLSAIRYIECNKFLFYFFKHIEKKLDEQGTGTTFRAISGEVLKNFPIYLPPVKEQHRIVAKIETLFSELDKGIESFKTAREQLKIYRQSLLKHAFSGKLTEQWRAENPDKLENAQALLQRIETERQQRYQQQLKDWEANDKQGSKPKALKTLPPLTTEELAALPELPNGWIYIRAEEISDFITKGTTPSKELLFEGNGEIPFIKVYNLTKTGFLDFSIDPTFVSRKTHNGFLARSKVYPGDVLMNIVGPPLGKVSIVPDSYPEWNINQAISIFRTNLISSRFLATYLAHEDTVRVMMKKSKATAGQFNLTLEICRETLIPFCGKNEQAEIENLIDAKTFGIDQLDQTITTALQQAEALRQSILKKAFSGQLVPQDPSDEPASVLLERIRLEKAALSVKPKSIKPKRCSL
jgi:type I restriction enzyme S subunit